MAVPEPVDALTVAVCVDALLRLMVKVSVLGVLPVSSSTALAGPAMLTVGGLSLSAI